VGGSEELFGERRPDPELWLGDDLAERVRRQRISLAGRVLQGDRHDVSLFLQNP
jgi:hypothetical protein